MRITIINTSDLKVVSDCPFGDDDDLSIWRVAVTESGRLVFATSDGLFTGKINDQGEFEDENHLLVGCDVQRSQVIQFEFVMCGVVDANSSKLMLVCLDDMDASTIIDCKGKSTFQLVRIPSTTCFIVRQYKKIIFVDPLKKKSFDLLELKDGNTYISRSLAITQADDKDPAQGFWMAYIDNKSRSCPQVKCLRFDKEVMEHIYKDHL